MSHKKIKIYKCKCERCLHSWITRKGKIPTVCPKCKNPYWNSKRRKK